MEESDKYNDETFGDAFDGPPGLVKSDQNLPSFFQSNTGVTLLDELAGMSLTESALEEDDLSLSQLQETFNTDEADDYLVDEKLPDFFSKESKMYDEEILEMNIGREKYDATTFPLPPGANVVELHSLQNEDQSQSTRINSSNHQQTVGQIPMQAMIPPPPQVLLCPPGSLPPAQSISALSTPGQMQAWHHQPQYHPNQARFHNNRHSQSYNQYPPMNIMPLRGVAPGLPPNNIAKGLSPMPPAPPLTFPSSKPNTVASSTDPPSPVDSSQTKSSGETSVPSSIPIALGLSDKQGSIPLPQGQPLMPQQLFRHDTAPKRIGLPCGSRMSPSDVRFVVGKVLQTTETHDPYNDDFYFIQLSMKRHGMKLDKAIAENKPLPPPLPIPLPTWTETKQRIRTQLEITRQHYEYRSRKWESKEKVLGHNVKSDVTKPRAVLSVESMSVSDQSNLDATVTPDSCGGGSSLDDMIRGLEEEPEEGTQPVVIPFSTVLWNMRAAAHKGYGALYVAQELRQLLNTPLVNSPQNIGIRNDILLEAKAAVSLVCKSVGLKEAPNEITASTDFLTRVQTNASTGALLDGGLVAALLQTTKGKKLMRRSICLLQANQRWTLLPVLVARILQRDPGEQSKEDVAVEAALLETIMDFIQFEENCILSRVEGGNNIPPAVLLVHLRQCIKSVMVSQMETKQLRKALVSSRKRAEVMNIILRLGDQIVKSFYKENISDEDNDPASYALRYIDSQRKADWTQLRDAFMLMLEN